MDENKELCSTRGLGLVCHEDFGYVTGGEDRTSGQHKTYLCLPSNFSEFHSYLVFFTITTTVHFLPSVCVCFHKYHHIDFSVLFSLTISLVTKPYNYMTTGVFIWLQST